MRIAFIIGCARSGTSITGELIGAHPKVKYLGERNQGFWHSWYGFLRNHHQLSEQDATPKVIKTIRDYFDELIETLPEGALIVDKCPPNSLRIPFLKKVFPEARFVHVVRDGRDVTCSLMPGVGGESWMHLKPYGWPRIMAGYDGVERCAVLWKTVIEKALCDLGGIDHLQIKYEALVREPMVEALKIMEYLALDPTREVLEFCHKIGDETEGSYQAAGQDVWFKDNHRRRIGRYNENMSPGEIDRVETLIGDMLWRLGYEVRSSF